MYTKDQLKRLIFIDIETSSGYEDYETFATNHPKEIKFWNRKAEQLRDTKDLQDKTDAGLYKSHAALYPEFGRIVCISIGQIRFDQFDKPEFLAKSFYGKNERDNILDFINFSRAIFNKVPDVKFVGHNVKNFDMPYIMKKAFIYNIKIPTRFHFHDVKPWENCLVDTLNLWRSSGIGYVSLEHLTILLNVDNPKEAEVYENEHGGIARAFWNNKLEELKDYCEEDIKATANILLRLSHQDTISEKTEINKT